MTPTQKEIFIVIDEFWKNYGYGPSIDEIMKYSGQKSRSNVSRICALLVKNKVCKRTPKMARSIRPWAINLRDIE